NGGKNSLNRLIRCVCGKKIGPDPRNFNQRVSLGRNDLLIRTFPKKRYPAYKRDWLVILMLNNFNKKQRATTLLLFLAGNNLRFVN
ncbi:hypothetical protein ACSTB9_10100, partial [Klebsiella pneumoniae]